jgi:hypothetical protein
MSQHPRAKEMGITVSLYSSVFDQLKPKANTEKHNDNTRENQRD